MSGARHPVRALVVGFGSAGRRHCQNLRALGVTDVALVRSGLGVLPAHEADAYPSFATLEAARDWSPTVAVISTPTALHLPVAQAAAEMGLDVFVEKPVSHTRDGIDALMRLVDAGGLVGMVGYQYRFHPLLRQLRSDLCALRFGQVVRASAEYAEDVTRWHPWEDHRRSYACRSDLGGGALLTLSHPIDYLLWLLGPVDDATAEIRQVDCLETRVPDDVAELSLTFESAVTARVHLDFSQWPPTHQLSIECTGGTATLDFLASTLEWCAAAGRHTAVHTAPLGYDRNQMFLDEMAHFLECVRTRRDTEVPLADGLAVLEVIRQVRHVTTV